MPTLDATIVGVYRRANAVHVRRALDPALERGWRTGWWALDGADPLLADVTVGEGAGLKLPLLNEALRRTGAASTWTVLSDDDVSFQHGDVTRLVEACKRAGFDLAQPARAVGTQRSHAITTAVRLSRARATTFVESGPMVAVGPRFRERILPLPEQRGMGWGIEIDWFDLLRDGCRLGIVDSIQIEHLGETAEHYDPTELQSLMRQELVERGHPQFAGMRETVGVWRPWQRRPPWVR